MSELPRFGELDLGQESLLYLAGELESPRLERFEKLLENDAAAQEQLALAVELTELLRVRPTRPDPSYRDAVRSRLLPPRSRSWFTPRLWTELAVAACLLLATWSFLRIDLSNEPKSPALEVVNLAIDPGCETARAEEADDKIDMATAWADMSNVDHYQHACEEDHKRRNRIRDTGHFLISTLMEEHGASLD